MIREWSTKRNEYGLARDTGKIDKATETEKKEDYWRGRENTLQKTVTDSVVIPLKMDTLGV